MSGIKKPHPVTALSLVALADLKMESNWTAMERCFLTWKIERVAFYRPYGSTGFKHRMSEFWVNTHSDSLSLAFLFRMIDRVGTIQFSTKEESVLSPDRSCKFTEKRIQLDFVSILCSKTASTVLLPIKYGKEKKSI